MSKALGKGLEELFTENNLSSFEEFENTIVEEAKTNNSIVEISLSDLRANPYQPRKNFDEDSLNELALSIKEHGVFQPIIVKKSIKGYEIIAGERRFRASKLAGKTTIPAIIKDFSDEEMMQIALLENLQRENLTAIEEAKAYTPSAKSMRLKIQPFTLIGATTRAGLLTGPLRDRFGVLCRLELYSDTELQEIINRIAIKINTQASLEIAKRSRGTPRIANRLLKRVRDFAEVFGKPEIDIEITDKALSSLEIDKVGLDMVDRKILEVIIKKFDGGPVGLDTLAAICGEDATTVEDVYEPYLLQKGYIARTSRGRIALKEAYEHLNLPLSKSKEKELELYENE